MVAGGEIAESNWSNYGMENWISGWDKAAWYSSGWLNGVWQDAGCEDSSKDLGHSWENCAGMHGAKEDDTEVRRRTTPNCRRLLLRQRLRALDTVRESDVQAQEDDQDGLRRLHEAALRRFLLDEPELGSDDEPLAKARPRMLNDHGIDVSIDVVVDPDTGGVTCKLCNIVLNSKSQWTDHQKGKKHFKKLSAKERRTGTNAQKLDKTNVPAGSYQ